jgi:hypothetical protein
MWPPGRYASNGYRGLTIRRHITGGATLRILCATAHNVRENRTHGSEGGEAQAFPTPIVARCDLRWMVSAPRFVLGDEV